MKKFSKLVKAGTKVMISGEWCTVKEVHDTKKWITVDEKIGSFQVGHVEKFSNR